MIMAFLSGVSVIKFKRLQKLSPDDKETLRTMQLHCLPDDEPYFPKNGWWWVGLDQRQVVAFCLVIPSSQWGDTAYLARSGVMPAWRGKGLQKRMVTIREQFAKKRGYRWMITDTTDNPASANNLISRGYKLYKPKNPWGYEITLYWRKRLRKD
jgi:GNAT superfamily N-acetyltransferase